MNNLKNNILNKIEKGEIQKTSRWYFLGKKYTFWGLFVFSLFSGAISFAILLKNTFDDFGAWYNLRIQENFILSNILWIWIITTIIFIISSTIYFKKTKSGFKYKNIYVILSSILASSFLGLIFYQIHLGHYIEHSFEANSNHYHKIKQEKRDFLKKYLEENKIDSKEFFRNKRILKMKEQYDRIDESRIGRIEYFLKNNKNMENIDEVRKLFEEIKIKKRKLDYDRLIKLIEEYKKE